VKGPPNKIRCREVVAKLWGSYNKGIKNAEHIYEATASMRQLQANNMQEHYEVGV